MAKATKKAVAKKAPAKRAAKKTAKRGNTMPQDKTTVMERRAFLIGQIHHPTKDWERLCLQLQRMPGVPPKEPTAMAAWNAPGPKHAFTSQDDIPFGALVFSKRPNAPAGDAGHVFSIWGYDRTGNRICRSNDIRTPGSVDACHIDAFDERWGHDILGWRDNVNGFRLQVGAAPSAERKKAMREKRRRG